MPEFEFHISRRACQKYAFDQALFGLDGRVLLADFSAARLLAERMGRVRGQAVPASDLFALGLIDEILHLLLRRAEQAEPGLLRAALEQAGDGAEAALRQFTEDFPPQEVFRGRLEAGAYLQGETNGRSHRLAALEEMLLLALTNANPAALPYQELFDDRELAARTPYREVIARVRSLLSGRPGQGEGGESLLEQLSAPARIAPHSLTAQLQYLLERWGALLPETFRTRLLRGLDFLREAALRPPGSDGGAGTAPVLTFGAAGQEVERFSADRDWMPSLVLLAKNTYVWLGQLSRQYGREIVRLDQVPNEELETLARRGLTGLWLIGLWERSRASQAIKQRMGDPEAVASAYSLASYDIAAELGGWRALEDLRARAARLGLRLSADMVPNHMGLDSPWVIEHPDWFLSLPHSPFPAYTFSGPDLSGDGRVGIQLEDHYYDRSDAAVVFQRIERSSGEVRYIYHGNDGTSMPWNDTAQLDFSKGAVREAVIQTILHVARNFPVIRFDAAMTLARQHIQRLWFPEPGAGGAIPSRAEHGMTQAEFQAAVPQEFWREVVDRVAAEAPDTLLLAEAFWLMEGYFVRSLGMHRVYNSAFMHMLRAEDNAGYRQVMKNVLEFDPEVLGRFVNFMSNPDEQSAVEQFGSTGKYFGVCTLMVTLPGLPMFAHGQIEGFHEKYGMEYRRAKWDEAVDQGLVNGHEGLIFPLARRRPLFAGAGNFQLYDFVDPAGRVNEDVFAFSNRQGAERALVVYHNRYAAATGRIRTACARLDKSQGQRVRRSLAEGLELPAEGYVLFRDHTTRLEYIRSCRELREQGLELLLEAYQCQVFLDWRFVDGPLWERICRELAGSGAPSLQARFDELAARAEARPEVPPPAAPKTSPARKRRPARTAGKSKQPSTAGRRKPPGRG